MLEFPTKMRRRELFPECASWVSMPRCTLGNPSEKRQEKPPPIAPDSNPPSHKTEPGALCTSARPAKRTAWAQTRLASVMRLSVIKASTREKESFKEHLGRREASRSHTLRAFASCP